MLLATMAKPATADDEDVRALRMMRMALRQGSPSPEKLRSPPPSDLDPKDPSDEEHMGADRATRTWHATAEDDNVQADRAFRMALRRGCARKEKLSSSYDYNPTHPKCRKLDLLHASFLACMALLCPRVAFALFEGVIRMLGA